MTGFNERIKEFLSEGGSYRKGRVTSVVLILVLFIVFFLIIGLASWLGL
jgi:hypothetical protein